MALAFSAGLTARPGSPGEITCLPKLRGSFYAFFWARQILVGGWEHEFYFSTYWEQ
jgi:hypothetical protein